MSEFSQVITSVGNHKEAERIATELVGSRLAACVQITGPVHSTFRWQGQLESAEEWLCLAKIRSDRFAEVAALVHKIHSYDVPEVIATPIAEVSEAYRAWLESELSAE